MSYKTLKSAQAAARKLYGANYAEHVDFFEGAEGWQFDTKSKPAAPNSEPENLVENPEPTAETVEIPQQDPSNADEVAPENADPEQTPAPWAGGSMMAGLVNNMLNGVPQPVAPEKVQKESSQTGQKIEKDREERNGIKRPSKGSMCSIIWDTADKITAESGKTCTSADLHNALQGYNDFTLRTQYARWRAFNGITGRLPGQTKTSSKNPSEFDDVKDNFMARLNPENTEAVTSLEAVTNSNELVVWLSKNASNF